jgi:hypothetical protein
MTDINGTISVGSYLDYSSCTWLIAPYAATYITLSFSKIDTEANYDFIRALQCNSSTFCSDGKLLGSYAGLYASPFPSVSTTNGYMLVRFNTDASVVRSGFIAEWVSNGRALVR